MYILSCVLDFDIYKLIFIMQRRALVLFLILSTIYPAELKVEVPKL